VLALAELGRLGAKPKGGILLESDCILSTDSGLLRSLYTFSSNSISRDKVLIGLLVRDSMMVALRIVWKTGLELRRYDWVHLL
jgi:hypothetical protein